jgi:hypothetical protein
LHGLAHSSRTILERSAVAHRILRSATAPDPAADFERGDSSGATEFSRLRPHAAANGSPAPA